MKKRIENHRPQAIAWSQKQLVSGSVEPAAVQSLTLARRAGQQGEASVRPAYRTALPFCRQARQTQQAHCFETWAHQKTNDDGACL